MVVLLTPDGIASDDKNLERNLNAAQRALETSADLSLALTIACAIVASGLITRVVRSMRSVPVIVAVLLLAGCSSRREKLPEAQPAPKGAELERVGKDLDVIDSRVAAAVSVAREANTAGKPAVVESELSVASSFLPKATEGDLAYARQRSEKATPAEYEAQRKKAAEKQKALEAEWANLEKQAAASKAALVARDARIVELVAELDRAKKDAASQLWTMAGIAMAALGGLCVAFVGPKKGLPLIVCGAAMGAVPFVIDSAYFTYVMAGTLGCLSLLLVWYAWDWVRDRVKGGGTA
jgi:outer membrane murein-binding lipoprotein Lpp